MAKNRMLHKKNWRQFRNAGLLWWVNRQLHLIGWAIVTDIDDKGEVVNAYPAKCKFRGFSEGSEEKGFKLLTKHMRNNMKTLLKDALS